MEDSTQLLARFTRLMRDVENGVTSRNVFRRWEVELLVDMQGCPLGSNRRRILRRYERAVHQSLERGATRPMKLSEYLERARRRNLRAPAA